jgi:hypothetical protein
MVNQFKNNKYEQHFYDLEKKESKANYKQVYYIPELEKKVKKIKKNLKFSHKEDIKEQLKNDLALLRNELGEEMDKTDLTFKYLDKLKVDKINKLILSEITDYLERLDQYYSKKFHTANRKLDNIRSYLLETRPSFYRKIKDQYYNESIADQVKKVLEKNKIIQYEDELIQHIDPIYQDPEVEGFLNFRAHFFAPRKYFMGNYFGTYWFNLAIIAIMTIIFYIALYYNALYKLLNLPQKVNFKKLIFRKS